MSKPKILVTGATGKTGKAVVLQLLEKGWPVRAVVRKTDVRSAELQKLGAEIAVADLYDPEQLVQAMTGTQRAYYLPPVQPFMIQSAVAFAVAAKQAKIESIVALTQWLSSPAHPAILTRQHWLVDNLFSMLPGIGHTVVNPGIFASPIMDMMPGAANMGNLPNPFGDGKVALVSNEDMARVVVGCLIAPEKHSGKCYHPTGPKLVSIPDVAEVFSRVLGRTVKAMPVSLNLFNKAMRSMGTDPFEIAITRHYAAEVTRGTFQINTPSNDVFEVSGQQPEDIETIARRFAGSPQVQQTFSNRLKALLDFARLIATPAIDLDRYEVDQAQPRPPHPLLAIDSPVWQREHTGSGKFATPKAGLSG